MLTSRTNELTILTVLSEKLKAYFELLKFRLSFLVSFSSGFGYVLASSASIDPVALIMFCLGGFLVSGASVTINQIWERDLDKLMSRTSMRPLPTGRVSVNEAIYFSAIVAFLGFSLIYHYSNGLTCLLSLISMLLYAFVYTPLKRKGPVAVFVGAIPGALPPLLGWVAVSGSVTHEALIIFGIQFIWQFPHFWAIAWVADEDYKKAGFKLLPMGGKKDWMTAVQIMTYTLFLLPLGLLPSQFGITGIDSAIIATLCGCLFLALSFMLIKDCSRKSALRIMFGSFLYLPIIQIAYLLDKV